MDRPFAGLLSRRFAVSGAPSARAAGDSAGVRWPVGARLRPGAALAALRARARPRRLLLVVLVCAPLLLGGWLWLRHSSFVAVDRVEVSGVQGPQAGAIEAALRGAARRMSTLDVNVAALRSAVAQFPVVREVRAVAHFPHELRIRVLEQPPVAVLAANGIRTTAAGDGVVLGPALLSGALPTLTVPVVPAVGARVQNAELLAELAVLGAAPPALVGLVANVFSGPRGLTVQMRNGLKVYFGDATRPHAKWLSLARVLADPSSTGAVYVDVRVPARPAAGFPAGVSPPSASGTAATGTEASTPASGRPESAVSTLATGLSAGGAGTSTGGGGAPATTTPSESPSGSGAAPAGTPGSTEAPSSETASGGAEASAGGAETGSGGATAPGG
jgi:cell division septal protein FtsQ